MVLIVLFTLGVGSMWGATTYKLTKVTSVSAGEMYVFEQDGYVMNNTISSSALQCTNNYKTTDIAGTETYVWTLETATSGFYMKNVNLSSNQYLNNSSSTGVSFGNKSSIWKFTFSNGVAVIQNTSNSNRFLGYTNSTSHAYKAYATSNMSGDTYPHNITVYKLEVESSAPTPVDPTATFSNGEYTVGGPALDLSTLWKSDSDGAVSYSISDIGTTNASISGTSFTATAAGTCTVQASQAATTNYNAITKTATITVSAAQGGGSGSGDNYTITFATGTNTAATTSSVQLSTMISDGDENVKSFVVDGTDKYVYHKGAGASNATGSGLRLGKSGGKGKITFNLSDEIAAQNLSSISVTTAAWDASTTVSLVVNGSATTTANAGNTIAYTPSTTTKLSSITLSATARAFIKTITITTSSSAEPTQLSAPTGLSATTTHNSATLSWGAVANAISYTVQLYGENADVIDTYTNITTTTKEISDLDPETEYIFGVVAVGDGTNYVNSNQAISDVFTTTAAPVTTCTVTYDANGGTGTAPADTKNPYNNGATVTVLGNYGKLTKDGYAFTGWNTAADGTGTPYKNGDTFTITGNTTLYAQWCEAYWKLVTDASELEDDTRIIIAAKDYNVALSTTQNTINRGQATITKKYNTVTFGAEVQTLSLVGLSNNLFALYTGSEYLYAASSSANQLKTGGTNNGNGFWSIAINQGVARILAQGDKTHNQIKYNHQQSDQLFSCYESTNTTMSDVVIYKEVCKQDSYNVTSTLTNATAANGNPTTVSATATSLTLNYTANTGYLLPETITVKMGGATLVSGTDYIWNKETGVLTITVTGFYGNIDVTIEAEEDPCYTFTMSEVTATSTTNSITLTWTEVAGATGYKVRLDEGEFTNAAGLTHTFEGLSPKTTYNWEVQAINGNCQASKTGSTDTQKETFTVSWSVNGNVTSTESVVDGEKIKNYPSDPSAPSGCSTKVFVGWTNLPIPTETYETPTLYTELNDIPSITDNTILHAVWADKTPIPGEDIATTETITCANLGYSNGAAVTRVDGENFSIVWDKGTNNNAPKYYSTGSGIRAYGGNYFTISSEKTITKVVLTFGSGEDSNAITTNSGTYSNNTWTGSSNSITFTVGGSSGHRRIATIAVTYTTKGKEIITYSAYTTLCDNCTPSDDLVLEASANTADLDINGKATITFSTTGGNAGAITYTANPKNGVSWENGVATFTQKGNYQITASQEKNDDSCPTVSNTLDVTITAIPHLYFTTDPAPTTIEFDEVECGGHTRLEDKKTVSVQGYNLESVVTVTVTGPYKIARTSGATLNDYDTKLTLDKNQDGHINGNYDDVYILSFPPAGSSESTEGTLTFKTPNGNTLTVNFSTPTITCTPRTLTFNDRGIKTTQEYYAGTEVPEPTTPTGVCGEYEFNGWALAKVESGSTTYAKVEFPYIMPANNQTVLHAVYRYTEGPTNEYERVTEIESGKNYVIAAYDQSNGYFALTNQESNTDGKFNSELVECDANNIITTDNSNIIWTVTGNDEDGYEFYNSAVQKYIEMYRYDGKSLLRLVDNCVNPFYINIEKDLNNDVTVDITSPEVDENYNVFSFYLELFNVYTRCDYNIYFYEQTATPLYTTTPDCHPSVILTSDGEVYVTATNGLGIMAATPLTLRTTDLAPNTEIAISSNSDDIYFSTERNTNFAMVAANQPQKSLTLTTNEGRELETPLYIHYKPSADGNGTPAEVVVTADVSTHNPPFTAQKTIHIRNLPAKFIIATKAGATWYALPANMNGATNPAAVVIEVDETTMTATAPDITPYTLWPVATINGNTDRYKEFGERLRFAAVNNGNKGLWANNSKEGTDINNYAAITAANSTAGAAYEWKVTTTVVNGQWQYTLYSDQPNNQNHLCYSMNQENPAWGTYASNEAKYQLYFLPIKAETTPFDYQVVEWYPNKVLIQTSTTFSSLTAKIAGEEVDDVTFERKDANQYEVIGLPLLENPAKALTLEFVVDAATHSGTHTIPVMLSGGEHSISDLSEITKGVYNYTNLVVRDGAKLTIDGSATTDNTFYDVTIYPTAKISVPEGKQLSVHRMTFLGGISEIYNGSTYTTNKYGVPQLSLKGTLGKTVTTMDYVMRVNLDQMYSLTVPYDVQLADIKYWDGTNIVLGEELYVSAYDGAARAQNLGANNNWVYETDFATKFGSATLKAGVGYTISAQPQTSGDNYAILRLPMKSNIASGNTEAAKSVAVTAHGADAAIADNHKGWNLVGNPYMASIEGADDNHLVLGYLKETGTGPWEWVEKAYRYVTIPSDDGTYYWQQKFTDAVLPPFKNFFVQIGTTGDLQFDLVTRQSMPARSTQAAIEKEVEFEILMSNNARQDNTGFLISEEYSPAYEINADLEKMIGSMSVYTIYGGYKLAYNALSPSEAKEWIPMGYIVPKVGEYTFKLDERAAVEDIIHIYLMDNETGAITDLIDNTYTFETSVKKNENRFAISVVLSQEESGTTTGVDDLLQQDKQAQKFIYNDQLFILSDGVVFDAMGQRITTINK